MEFRTVMWGWKDEIGHGSHVASIAAGEGAVDRFMSRAVGVEVACEGVSRSRVLSIKCLGYYIGTGRTSDVIEAVEFSIRSGGDVVNMSMGYPAPPVEDDPLAHPLEVAVEGEAIPVAAAGNSGPGTATMSSPASLPYVLAVGAYDPITGELCEWSSRGPTPDGLVKPDAVAPGARVDSACVGIMDMSDKIPNRFSPESGTSMAAAHASGLVCIMRECMDGLLGRRLTVWEVFRMMEELGEPKNNDSGWGPLYWEMFEAWLEAEYGYIFR